ncbi:hypothetical protein K8R78_03250, partial [bacterium]|nr:hypothetical protein [bacterium]
MIKGLLRLAVDHATRYGASYAEARFQDLRSEDVSVKNGMVQTAGRSFDKGFGVRVLYNGAWGFACSSVLTEAEMRRTAAMALGIAKAAASVRHDNVILDELDAYVDYWSNYDQVRINPFNIPIEKKVDFLLEATNAMKVGDQIA